MNADFFAKKAAEHAQKCTKEENQQRAENGRKTNVAHVFEEEDAAIFLSGGGFSDPQDPAKTSGFFGATIAIS